MASISTDKSGNRRILYFDENRKRRVLYIGKVSERDAEGVQRRVESMLAARILGNAIDRDDARWLSESPTIREKLERLDLIPSGKLQIDRRCMSMEEFLDDYIERHGASRKPATVAVWKQVVANLKEFMPEGIRINQITAGHAKEFHEKLKARGMATTTIHKRIQFARQFMHDAVDWKIIDENPFCKVKTQKSSVKVNEFVPREVVDKLMKKANPVWQVILGLSRYGGLRTPSETLSLRWDDIDWELNRMSIPEPKVEHHEGRGIRSCPIFPELRPILDEAFEIFGDKSDYVVAAPQYRAAANTAMGWKNANLRSEMTRLLRRAGVSGWTRLFHSMRASRQTELQREFPLHVVCSWLGNSPRIAQQSYLLVTEDDFSRAAGAKKEGRGDACRPPNGRSQW
ncbi:MAG: Tyrosine recombinase XerC [Planctomycetota bacterium]|jgi:integrase